MCWFWLLRIKWWFTNTHAFAALRIRSGRTEWKWWRALESSICVPLLARSDCTVLCVRATHLSNYAHNKSVFTSVFQLIWGHPALQTHTQMPRVIHGSVTTIVICCTSSTHTQKTLRLCVCVCVSRISPLDLVCTRSQHERITLANWLGFKITPICWRVCVCCLLCLRACMRGFFTVRDWRMWKIYPLKSTQSHSLYMLYVYAYV